MGLILPDRDLPINTREILYTALTRSRQSVVIVGSREIFEAGIRKTISRDSGIVDKLKMRTRRLDDSSSVFAPGPARAVGGGPGKRWRARPNHATASTTADLPRPRSIARWAAACRRRSVPTQPATLSTASGRYQRPRSQGPIAVQVRPYAQAPRAVGSTYET